MRRAANSATIRVRRLRTCGLNSKLPQREESSRYDYALKQALGKRTIQATSERRSPPFAVGIAPGNYRATPEVKTSLRPLREYLNREFAVQTPINRVLLLWAAAKLPGLIEPDRRRTIIGELLKKQQPDGGWNLSSLSGNWKADGTPQETRSDGYATGLITFVLQQAGTSPENAKLKQGLAWLTANRDGRKVPGRPTL